MCLYIRVKYVIKKSSEEIKKENVSKNINDKKKKH